MDKIFCFDTDVVCLLSTLDHYDYIIVGSGFGGGILANTLANKQKKVLLIERGGPLFTTHILNTSRPYFDRGKDDSPEGNETVYDAVKAKVQISEDSEAYIGGPVYCLGGRSNVWGLWIPKIADSTLDKFFPKAVRHYLNHRGYKNAFHLVTNNSQKEDSVYPTAQYSPAELDKMIRLLEDAVKDAVGAEGVESPKFDIMPVALDLDSKEPYRLPRGAYSTSVALLNRLYAKDKYLTVLMDTEVLRVDVPGIVEDAAQLRELDAGHWCPDNLDIKRVSSLTIRSTKDQKINKIQAGKAKVILSAGTIGTATIALNSGLQYHNCHVGEGLIDHDFWYVRFAKRCIDSERSKPMTLKRMVKISKHDVLVTVTINANFFLAGSSAPLQTTQYLGPQGRLLAPSRGFKTEEFNTVTITFEFHAELDNANKVLDLPAMDHIIRARRRQLDEATQQGMDDITRNVRNIFVNDVNLHDVIPPPRPQLLGFGVFSHEVGTMRMKGPVSCGPVDSDLKVRGFDNLYVCDLSVFPVSPQANPSLTLTALSLRLAEHFGGGWLAPRKKKAEDEAEKES